jgi:hypothetical protein
MIYRRTGILPVSAGGQLARQTPAAWEVSSPIEEALEAVGNSGIYA